MPIIMCALLPRDIVHEFYEILEFLPSNSILNINILKNISLIQKVLDEEAIKTCVIDY